MLGKQPPILPTQVNLQDLAKLQSRKETIKSPKRREELLKRLWEDWSWKYIAGKNQQFPKANKHCSIHPQQNLRPGDLVLLIDESLIKANHFSYPLRRVIATKKDSDDMVREVELIMARSPRFGDQKAPLYKGYPFKRSVQSLAKLEINDINSRWS